MAPKLVFPIRWIQKPGELWSSAAGPFALKVEPKGDGRWSWQVFVDSSSNPSAAGVAASLGAAKTVTEQFVKRSGRV
jgi:hypothetical protein